MIEVRIRYASEGDSKHLFTWPATELDSVLPLLRKWGVDGEYDQELAGQFHYDSSGAYFEVIINDDED